MNIEQYIAHHCTSEPAVLSELVRQTHLRVLQPRMLSGNVQGRLLSILTAIVAPKRVLELGTFTGYSAICIAQSMSALSELHTVDSNDELQGMAYDFFVKAGVQHIVHQHIGRALEIMPTFGETFDMVFIDADKREYLDYYNMLFDCNLVRSGSVIIADNTIWDGKVIASVAPNDKHTQAILRFNDFVTADSRVEQVMLPLRDGLTIIRIK